MFSLKLFGIIKKLKHILINLCALVKDLTCFGTDCTSNLSIKTCQNKIIGSGINLRL